MKHRELDCGYGCGRIATEIHHAKQTDLIACVSGWQELIPTCYKCHAAAEGRSPT